MRVIQKIKNVLCHKAPLTLLLQSDKIHKPLRLITELPMGLLKVKSWTKCCDPAGCVILGYRRDSLRVFPSFTTSR